MGFISKTIIVSGFGLVDLALRVQELKIYFMVWILFCYVFKYIVTRGNIYNV